MKNKKSWLVILLSIAGMIVATVLSNPVMLGFCPSNGTSCTFKFIETYSQPLGFISLTLLPIGILLLFLRPEVFKTWLKFAAVALPLGIIWIVSTAIQDTGGGIGMVSIDREIITWIVSILFLVISLIIIIVKSLRLRQ